MIHTFFRRAAVLALCFLSFPIFAAGAPEVTVLRNGVEIVDGSTDTVYGAVSATSLSVTYVIANTGAEPLTIGVPTSNFGTGSTGISSQPIITPLPATVIAPGTSSPWHQHQYAIERRVQPRGLVVHHLHGDE